MTYQNDPGRFDREHIKASRHKLNLKDGSTLLYWFAGACLLLLALFVGMFTYAGSNNHEATRQNTPTNNVVTTTGTGTILGERSPSPAR